MKNTAGRQTRNRNASASTKRQAVNAKSDLSRKQILDAAAKLFHDQGYAATTLRQIAQKAKMKAGSIYYHFGSKNEILDEVLDLGLGSVFASVRSGLRDLPDSASNRERIERAIACHLEALFEHGDYTSANIRIFGQLPKKLKLKHHRFRKDYGALWEQLFRDAQNAGEIRSDLMLQPLRMFVLGALNWTVEWYDPKRTPVRELADRVALLIFDGIGTHPGDRRGNVVRGRRPRLVD